MRKLKNWQGILIWIALGIIPFALWWASITIRSFPLAIVGLVFFLAWVIASNFSRTIACIRLHNNKILKSVLIFSFSAIAAAMCTSVCTSFYYETKAFDKSIQIEQLQVARDAAIEETEKKELLDRIWAVINEKLDLEQKARISYMTFLVIILINIFLEGIKPKSESKSEIKPKSESENEITGEK